MKKLVAKTAFITLGVALILLLSLFGVLSLCVPYLMANFTNSLGLYTLSGDYAFQEYKRSGNIEYLSRSFDIAYKYGSPSKAEERFELFVADEGFEEFCALNDEKNSAAKSGRYFVNDVYGRGACVKYRLATSEDDMRAVCDFAIEHTSEAFEPINPVIWLTVEAAGEHDGVFCSLLLDALENGNFNETDEYNNMKNILNDTINKSKEDTNE